MSERSEFRRRREERRGNGVKNPNWSGEILLLPRVLFDIQHVTLGQSQIVSNVTLIEPCLC